MSLFSLFSWHEYDDGLQNVGQAQRIEFKDLFDVPIQSAKKCQCWGFLISLRWDSFVNGIKPLQQSDIFWGSQHRHKSSTTSNHDEPSLLIVISTLFRDFWNIPFLLSVKCLIKKTYLTKWWPR